MVHRSPSANCWDPPRDSPSSGQLSSSSNSRVTPKEREMMRQSWNFPWNRSSSSACQPTIWVPSSYRFRLQLSGILSNSFNPQCGITSFMSSIIHTGYGVGCTVIPPYSYVQLQPCTTIQAVFRGIGPHLVDGCIHLVPTLTFANHAAVVAFSNGFAKCAAKLRRDSSFRKYVHRSSAVSPMSCRFTLERGSSQSVPASFGGGGSSCFHARSVASLVCSGEVCGSVFCLFAGTSGMTAGMTHLARAALSCAMASANVYRDWAKCFMAHYPHKDLKIEDNGNNEHISSVWNLKQVHIVRVYMNSHLRIMSVSSISLVARNDALLHCKVFHDLSSYRLRNRDMKSIVQIQWHFAHSLDSNQYAAFMPAARQ